MSAGSLSENHHTLAIKPHQPSCGPIKEEQNSVSILPAAICGGMKYALCWKASVASLCCNRPASSLDQLQLLRPSLCQTFLASGLSVRRLQRNVKAGLLCSRCRLADAGVQLPENILCHSQVLKQRRTSMITGSCLEAALVA